MNTQNLDSVSKERVLNSLFQESYSPEQFYEAICQGSPDVIVIVDRQGNMVFVNDRSYELLGYTPEELIGKNVECLVPPQFTEHARLRTDYHRAPEPHIMGNRPILSAWHKSGVEIPVDIALSPLPEIGGRVGMVLAAIRNALPRWSAYQEQYVQSVALNAAANGIIITDCHGVICWANPSVSRMTGYSLKELVGHHTRILKSGQHEPSFYKDIWDTVLAGKTWFGSITNKRKDGSLYYEEQHIAPVISEKGEVTHFIAIKQDITSRKIAELALKTANEELNLKIAQIESLHYQLREQAIRDPLTGLFNRRYLEETMVRERARVRRERKTLSLVLIDVDNFKQVNDTAGHAAGDLVLKALAELLLRTTRTSDVACRMGGDEFLILLPGASLKIATQKAEHWRKTFYQDQHEILSQTGHIHCSLSLGVTELRTSDESTDSLLNRADEYLYMAKKQGRNQVVASP